MERLEGKVAIVTGGASGIGRATCFSLAREKATIIIVDINQEQVEEAVSELINNGFGSVMGQKRDVRSETDMEEMVNDVVHKFNQIDILVHCAAILRGKGSGPRMLFEISMDEWNQVIDTNLKGTFLCNRAVVSTMIKQRSGHIINLSSISGRVGRPFDSVYCASKSGVIGLTEALSEEVRQYGVRVQAVLPGPVNTPIWEQNKHIKAPPESLPPERVADVITYLIKLPADTICDHIVVKPFVTRRRKKADSAK
jgi:NAD(P)-dependent dehydrogenase (short-subunit alcohol dehydrogenase family)